MTPISSYSDKPTADRLFEHSCKPSSTDGVCRSRGGESCAFDGAMIVLQCIADAAHLVHGPIACLGNSWESRGTVSDKGDLHRRAYTTDLSELDIVYGSESKLLSAIEKTYADCAPKAIFVYATCVTGLIGEDIDAVCKKGQESLGIPVISVHSPGFVGPKNLGNRIAGEVLLDHVIGTGEPELITSTDVNLIGEYNIAGDLDLVEPVLKSAGINILSRITGNASYSEITHAHKAKLNVVVCGRALINVAREMELRYGIPYVEVSFFGSRQMRDALETISRELLQHNPTAVSRVNTVVLEQERKLEEALQPYAFLKGKKAVLYTGGVKSWSFISALMDLGIEVVAIGTKKSTVEDEEKMKKLLGPNAPLHENMVASNILELMKKHDADMLIAGGRNRYLAAKEGFPFVDVNQERHIAYAGYDGLVNLAEQISAAVNFYNFDNKDSRKQLKPKVHNARLNESLSINPLKHSPSIGAAIALQGIDNAMTVLHGSQGCNFLGKVLLTRHFMEPISMMSTKVFAEDVVMGSEERLQVTVKDVLEKNSPEIVGVLSTALAEVRGEDFEAVLGEFSDGPAVVMHVPTPDYKGGLEEGYAAAVEKLVLLAEPESITKTDRVNIIVGSNITPADACELRNIIEDFGLEPVFLPDPAALDGSRDSFSAMASGGTGLDSIRTMGSAALTLIIGPSLTGAGELLFERCNKMPFVVLDSLTGLAASDKFFSLLLELSGREDIPARYQRDRKVLVDGMRDALDIMGGKRIALAQEADTALALCGMLQEMMAEVPMVVIPTEARVAKRIPAQEVVIGDYGSLKGQFDLLVAGSHGKSTAKELGARHFEWGFPVFNRLGINSTLTVGYRGTLNMINQIGNHIGNKLQEV